MVYDAQSRVFLFFFSIVIGSGTEIGRSGDRLVTWLISEISNIEFLISMFHTTRGPVDMNSSWDYIHR